jgi:AcrR family transcriptional regulator
VDRSAATRRKILDAAARLYATKGIDNVSLNEIVRTAGQGNASAVHYHFGNRDGVLLALVERHAGELAARRRELMNTARSRPRSVRAAAEAIVRPITEFAQRGWRERAYLQIGAELAQRLDALAPELQDALARTEGAEAWAVMHARCPRVPDDLWFVRQQICVVFVGRAAADRARRLDGGGRARVLSDDRFVDNLVDMVVGAMTAKHRS